MSRARLLAFALFAGAAVACGASSEAPSDAETADEMDVAESQALFGDDRVGAALKAKPALAPKTFAELEKLFGIGRACSRADSKEIFVVEEAATRIDGATTTTSMILPRAIVAGCNKNPADPNSRDSFTLYWRACQDLTPWSSSPSSPSGMPSATKMASTPARRRRCR